MPGGLSREGLPAVQMTNAPHSPRSKAERLVAAGRVLLILATLLALTLEPYSAGLLAGDGRGYLVLYLLYGLVLMLLTWENRLVSPRLIVASQVVDLLCFTLLLALSGGSDSPLFVLFLFSIFSGALRWRSRGSLLTTLAVLGLYWGLACLERFLGIGAVQADSLILRTVYVGIAALALGYLTAYEQRTRLELSRLLRWSNSPADEGDLEKLLRESLRQVQAVLGVPQALLVLDEPEEPFSWLAQLNAGEFACSRCSPEDFEPLVTPVLAETDFLCHVADRRGQTMIHTPGGNHRWQGLPWNGELQARFSLASSLWLRVQSEHVQGRLVLSGRADLCADDLYLGGLMARQLASTLEGHYARQRLGQLVQAQERIRLARDLHDGLLQSLAGVGLQLELLRRQADRDPEVLNQRIAQLQSLIVEEQRGLRQLIGQLKPDVAQRGVASSLGVELSRLASGIEYQWGIRIQLHIDPSVTAMDEPLAGELRFLLREALANSGKHARASQVRAQLGRQGERLYLGVRDDGQGFAFVGRHDLASLMAMQAGPRSLMERTLALGGQLVIESRRSGSLLEITLPWHSTSHTASPQAGSVDEVTRKVS